MIEATSCGGVVIFRGKVLVLYKNYKNKYEGWVLPKGTVEPGEEFKDTAAREVLEETGVDASIIKYVGKSQYSFTVPEYTLFQASSWSVFSPVKFSNALAIPSPSGQKIRWRNRYIGI